MEEMTIKFINHSCNVPVSIKRGSIIEKKTISFDNLVSSILSSYSFTTGLLPRGTRFFSGNDMDFILGLEIPPTIRVVKYEYKNNIKTFDKIPFPSNIFVFYVKNKTLINTKLFSLKTPIITDKDKLCFFPFGNVYSNGEVCWGKVNNDKILNKYSLVSVISLFFNSIYNNDLYNSNRVNYNYSLEELLSFLNGKDSFPIDLLEESITLDMLIRSKK